MNESEKFFLLNGEKFYLYEAILFKPKSIGLMILNGVSASTTSMPSNYATIGYPLIGSQHMYSSNTSSIGYQTIKFVTSSGTTTVSTENEEYGKWTINFITEYDKSYEIVIKQNSTVHRLDISKDNGVHHSVIYANDRIKKMLNPNTILKNLL